jgi:hypothetical protein
VQQHDSGVGRGKSLAFEAKLRAKKGKEIYKTPPVDRRAKPCTHAKFRAKIKRLISKKLLKSRIFAGKIVISPQFVRVSGLRAEGRVLNSFEREGKNR